MGWTCQRCPPSGLAQAEPFLPVQTAAFSVFHVRFVLRVCLAPTGLAPGPGVASPRRLAGSVAPRHRLHGLGTWAFPAFRFSQRAVCVPRRKSLVSTACGKACLLPGTRASRWRCPGGSSRCLLLLEPCLRGPRYQPAEAWPGPGSVLLPGLSQHLPRGSRRARCSGWSLVRGAFSQTKRLFRCFPGSHFNY